MKAFSIELYKEMRLRHFDPSNFIQYIQESSPSSKKTEMQFAAGKVMATVFWKAEGILLIKFMPIMENLKILELLKKQINAGLRNYMVQPMLPVANIIFQNSRKHWEAVTSHQMTYIKKIFFICFPTCFHSLVT